MPYFIFCIFNKFNRNTMRHFFKFGLCLLCLALVRCQPPIHYDLVILNGRVFDAKTGSFHQQDVAINGDRIVGLGSFLMNPADRVIDADGLIVSPGFIDMHAHIEAIMRLPTAESFLKQGVTTVLGGPDGRGPSPMKDYLDSLETFDLGINTAYLVGHNTVRRKVMGMENREPSAEELAAMKAQVEEAMTSGAYGISTGLKYIPGAYSKIDEVIALSEVAAKYDGIYTSHLREEGLGLIEGVQEAIEIGREADIPIILTHHKAIGRPMWGSSVKTLAMVDSARKLGLDIMMDQYPYTASSTGIAVLIPAWAMAGGQKAFKARVDDPVTREKIIKEIMFNIEFDRGGADLVVVQFANVNWRLELNGKTLKDWCIEEGLEPTFRNGAELVVKAQLKGGASCIFHAIGEEDVQRIMQHPMSMVASDGGLVVPGRGHPHPRSYGTFPRVLGHYVREKKIIELPLALQKMTSIPADRLGLNNRGYVEVDYLADLTLFDPETIIDKGTFEAPHQYPEGIAYVVVNGQVTIDQGELTAQRAGRVLRKKLTKRSHSLALTVQ